MKQFFLFLILLSISFFSQSQIVIKNANGEVLAYESADGHIQSASDLNKFLTDSIIVNPDSSGLVNNSVLNVSNTLGIEDNSIENDSSINIDTLNSTPLIHIKDEFSIVTTNGVLVAKFNSSSQELIDLNNKLLFKLSSNGDILNSAGVKIGSIDADNKVYEASGNLIGEGVGFAPFKLAYFFFYSNR